MSEVIVRLSDGRTLRKPTEVYPSGHWKNPASDDTVQAKLSALIEPRIGAEGLRRLAARVQILEDWESASEIFSIHAAEI